MVQFCSFCDLLRVPQSDPTFIAEFEHSVAYLNFEQEAYPGQSLLILKDHYEHLHLTPINLPSARLSDEEYGEMAHCVRGALD